MCETLNMLLANVVCKDGASFSQHARLSEDTGGAQEDEIVAVSESSNDYDDEDDTSSSLSPSIWCVCLGL